MQARTHREHVFHVRKQVCIRLLEACLQVCVAWRLHLQQQLCDDASYTQASYQGLSLSAVSGADMHIALAIYPCQFNQDVSLQQ